MKINEVEQQAGITKRNIRFPKESIYDCPAGLCHLLQDPIRFYEQQGLLSPKRNGENGYRDYSEEDVEELKKIKLLRKLSLPIEEIRKIQSGALVLEDALMRQVIVLEREKIHTGIGSSRKPQMKIMIRNTMIKIKTAAARMEQGAAEVIAYGTAVKYK